VSRERGVVSKPFPNHPIVLAGLSELVAINLCALRAVPPQAALLIVSVVVTFFTEVRLNGKCATGRSHIQRGIWTDFILAVMG
jgi:hypothetical protein